MNINDPGNPVPEPLTYNVDELAAVIGMSKPSIWRKIRNGEVPAPKKCGKWVRWSRRTITDWLAAK